jgi:16S rRNA (guanine966-N2)-methyltransferase
MRIISGHRRGHKIDGPKASNGTRPTSDMVRESLFNILRELVVDRLVIDLFAGTGALGLEALSRGARQAIFVERDRENVALIHRNIATLRYQDRAGVRHADAYRWARSYAPADDAPVVVFLDPPYREYEIHAKYLNRMLAGLVGKLPAGSVIVLESGRTLDDRILPDFDAWDIRRYGGTQLALRVIDQPIEAAVSGDDPEASGAEIEAETQMGEEVGAEDAGDE